jgi:hypothetical protein
MKLENLYRAPLLLTILLALTLATPSMGQNDPGQLYPSKDKVFSVRLSSQFFKRLSDGSASVFNAVSSDGTLVLVVGKTSDNKLPLANIKRDFPKRAGPSWKILGSSDNDVGGKPAVFYHLSNVFPAPGTDSAQLLKKFGLPANSTYNTVMAIVPTGKGTYTFQAHHHESLGDKGLQGVMGLLSQLVIW